MKILYRKSNIKKPAIFLDRDGVINYDKPGKYILSKKDIKIYKSAINGLKKIKLDNYHLIIITNQSAIGRGMISLKKAIVLNNYIEKILRKNGVKINAIYFCPHRPQDGCKCRKPKTGLIEEAKKDFEIDIKKSFLIGDKGSDIKLGKRMKIKTILVKTGQANNELKNKKINPDFIIKNLLELKKILGKFILIIILLASVISKINSHQVEDFEKLFPKKVSNETDIYEYDIYWGFLNVGNAYINFGSIYENEKNIRVYKILTVANSNQFIDNFFKVRDTNISYLDVNLNRSYGYLKDIKEGKHEFKEYTIFDYTKMKYYGALIKKDNIKEHQGDLEGNTFDTLSSLFLIIKSSDIESSKRILNITTKSNKKIEIINHGLVDLKINAKRYKAYKLEPKVGDDAIFIAKKGKSMYVYISKNEKIPLMLEAEVFIGAVRAILKNHIKQKNWNFL